MLFRLVSVSVLNSLVITLKKSSIVFNTVLDARLFESVDEKQP